MKVLSIPLWVFWKTCSTLLEAIRLLGSAVLKLAILAAGWAGVVGLFIVFPPLGLVAGLVWVIVTAMTLCSKT